MGFILIFIHLFFLLLMILLQCFFFFFRSFIGLHCLPMDGFCFTSSYNRYFILIIIHKRCVFLFGWHFHLLLILDSFATYKNCYTFIWQQLRVERQHYSQCCQFASWKIVFPLHPCLLLLFIYHVIFLNAMKTLH